MGHIIESWIKICKENRLEFLNDIVYFKENHQLLKSKGFIFVGVSSIVLTKENMKIYLRSDELVVKKEYCSHNYKVNGEKIHRMFALYHGKINVQDILGNVEDLANGEVYTRDYFWMKEKLY